MRNLFSLIFATFLICSCQTDGYVNFSGFAQGGTWSVKADLKGASRSYDEIRSALDSILILVDTTFSGYNSSSILSRLNAGEPVEPNDCFLRLKKLSDSICAVTGGAFDVSAGPLFDIWGFGFMNDSLPSPGNIAEALALSRSGKTLNFNAIAQGYTCDLVAGYLREAGVRDMLVDIGEIYCQGKNPHGKGWTIGIDTPVDGNNTPGAMLSAIWTSDGGSHGVVTSGNYRKFYVRDGVKYSHTIDPRTGYPVTHNLLSATVIAKDATTADALATYFMVIGFEKARTYVLSHPDIESCLITSDDVWKSPGF